MGFYVQAKTKKVVKQIAERQVPKAQKVVQVSPTRHDGLYYVTTKARKTRRM